VSAAGRKMKFHTVEVPEIFYGPTGISATVFGG
jgi:hypothetical protein